MPIPLRAYRLHLTAAQGPRLKAARMLRACDDAALNIAVSWACT
jgi:hypothetical protein